MMNGFTLLNKINNNTTREKYYFFENSTVRDTHLKMINTLIQHHLFSEKLNLKGTALPSNGCLQEFVDDTLNCFLEIRYCANGETYLDIFHVVTGKPYPILNGVKTVPNRSGDVDDYLVTLDISMEKLVYLLDTLTANDYMLNICYLALQAGYEDRILELLIKA